MELPILAHRAVMFSYSNGNFYSLMSNELLPIRRAEARCDKKLNGTFGWRSTSSHIRNRNRNHDHVAPSWDCSCGFYSLTNPSAQFFMFSYMIATVQLYGRVIEHTGGFRAQYQDILDVSIPNHCTIVKPCRNKHEDVLAVSGKTAPDGILRGAWLCETHLASPYHTDYVFTEFLTREQIESRLPVPLVESSRLVDT
jgi:hypothetical protein